MYLLLYGFYPFDASSTSQLMLKILTEELRFKHAHEPSLGAQNFLKNCLQRIPRRRYTAKQALQDKWIMGEAAEDKAVNAKALRSARKLSMANVPAPQPEVVFFGGEIF